MLVDQRLELADQLGVAAQRQLVFNSLLTGVQAQLIEPSGLADGKRLAGEIRQSGPAPHVQRPGQQARGLLRRRRPGGLHELLELRCVKLVGRDLERVAGRLSDQHVVGGSTRLQRAAELRHVDLDDVV